VCARAEQWSAGLVANDVVTARAVAAQPVVLEYAAPLLRLGGVLVDWRGRRSSAEEAAARTAAAELGLELREIRRVTPFARAAHRHLHVFEKVAQTPPRFPRRAGIARKRPLGAAASDREHG
jgi:16S rRNA (guanine527-N7)-methyltransferase